MAPGQAHPLTIVMMGPTASGKSKLAITLAAHLGAEIISADSVGFYRGFNIASAKPSPSDRAQVKHHLIDVLDAHEPASVGWFCTQAAQIITAAHQRGRAVVVVGGSRLYLKGLLGENFHQLPTDQTLRTKLCQQSVHELMTMLTARDPERARQIHPNDHFRLARACEIAILSGKTMAELTSASQEPPPWRRHPVLRCLICPPTATLHKHIHQRTYRMLRWGLITEVQELLAQGVSTTSSPMQSIGYKQTAAFIHGQLPAAISHRASFTSTSTSTLTSHDLSHQIMLATRRLAKKQRTWAQQQHYDLMFQHHHPAAIISRIHAWIQLQANRLSC